MAAENLTDIILSISNAVHSAQLALDNDAKLKIEEYKKDEDLRNLPVPHPRLSNLSFDLKYGIQNLTVEANNEDPKKVTSSTVKTFFTTEDLKQLSRDVVNSLSFTVNIRDIEILKNEQEHNNS